MEVQQQLTFWSALWLETTVKRALKVCMIVGTILCLINQWEAIISGFVGVNWLKVILTYMVPYSVSSFSSAASRLEFEREKGALAAQNTAD